MRNVWTHRRRALLGAGLLVGLVVVVLAVSPPIRSYLSGATDTARPEPSVRVVAAGDIACSLDKSTRSGATPRPRPLPTADKGAPSNQRPANSCAESATADLINTLRPAAVLPLGDTQYECGAERDFAGSYAKTWGAFLDISRPAIGNHEYGHACQRDDPSPFFSYFGSNVPSQTGYYSFDLGSWHLIALNSECSSGRGPFKVGGCETGSAQERWLQDDLRAHPSACTLAYWHEPRFSSGQHGSAAQMADIWNDLVAAKVDVVLAGHNHDYERFAPLGQAPRPPGWSATPRSEEGVAPGPVEQPTPDPNGVQEFVVGTGGKNHYRFPVPPLTGEEVRDDETFGVLSLDLRARSYDWRFVPVKGATFADSGTMACR